MQPGDIVGGRYRIVREIGRGGMGVVFSAADLQLPQRVAIKVLHENAKPDRVKRFVREAHTVVRIQSEHICRVLDVGTLAARPERTGGPYIVMELLDGCDLSEHLERHGPLPIEDAVDVVLQACEGIAAAHLLGVVHRDLKPSNLFKTGGLDGRVHIKVLDFGISKMSKHGAEQSELTASDALIGSPRFMSPEQLSGPRSVDQRTDIWSMCVVLYELLTGAAAFARTTRAELFVAILQEAPTAVTQLRPEVPTGLADVIERGMQKEMDERYANIAELALALQPYAPSHAQTLVDRIERMFAVEGRPPPLTASPQPTSALRSSTLPMGAAEVRPRPGVSERRDPSMAPSLPAQRDMIQHDTTQRSPVAEPTLDRAATSLGRTAPANSRVRRVGWGLGAIVVLAAGALWLGPAADESSESPAVRTAPRENDSDGSSPSPKGSNTSSASSDPLRVKLDKARRDFDADDFARAKKRLSVIVDRVTADGVQVGSPRAKLGAEAQLMLVDIEREMLEWPEAELDGDGKHPKPMDGETTRLFVLYNSVFRFQDVGVLQCAEARRSAVFLDYAKWLWRTKIPSTLSVEQREDVKASLLVRTQDAAFGARSGLQVALARKVSAGEGCRREAEQTHAAVKAFIAALPPGRFEP